MALFRVQLFFIMLLTHLLFRRDAVQLFLVLARGFELLQAPLLLCYFLVQKDARRLERLIAKEGLPNVEVHCFA